MAAPNLAAPVKILGKSAYTTAAVTTELTLVTNSSGSSTTIRLTNLMVANIDGTNSADATVRLYSAASGGTGFPLALTVAVPADSSLVVVSRENPIYVEEDRRITVQSSAANRLTFLASYEEVT